MNRSSTLRPLRRFCGLFALWLGAGLAVVGQNASPPAAPENAATYQIASGDRVRIEVFGESDLTAIARVDASGRVNLNLVGEVNIAGRTVSDAQRTIELAYRDGRYLRTPQVTINIEEYAPREVIIQGEVRQPGRYNLPPEAAWTVIDLISRAQGLTDTARGSSVTLSRTGANGQQQVFTVDAESIIRGRRTAGDGDRIILQPGDVINVPQRLF